MNFGPIKIGLLCSLFALILLGGFASLQLQAQATTGGLTINNSTTEQDYPSNNVGVRTIVFVCAGSVQQGDTILQGSSVSLDLAPGSYNVYSFNETTPVGGQSGDTFISSSSFFAEQICSGFIPATLNVVEVTANNEVIMDLNGQTSINFDNNNVATAQVISAVGTSSAQSGLRIGDVFYGALGPIGGLESGFNPFLAVCVNGQFFASTDATTGFIQINPGTYTIQTALGAAESFSCIDGTDVQVTINPSETTTVYVGQYPEQANFFGPEALFDEVPLNNGNGGQQQDSGANDQNNGDPAAVINNGQSGDPNSAQGFSAEALSDNNSQSGNDGLIRSGGANWLILLGIVSLFGLIALVDSMATSK